MQTDESILVGGGMIGAARVDVATLSPRGGAADALVNGGHHTK